MVCGATSTRFTRPWTQQQPLRQGAWSTCSQDCSCGGAVGGSAFIESNELNSAQEPHSSSNTCTRAKPELQAPVAVSAVHSQKQMDCGYKPADYGWMLIACDAVKARNLCIILGLIRMRNQIQYATLLMVLNCVASAA